MRFLAADDSGDPVPLVVGSAVSAGGFAAGFAAVVLLFRPPAPYDFLTSLSKTSDESCTPHVRGAVV